MKIRRLDKSKEALGYCNDCHNRAAFEIYFRADRSFHLCVRDARYLVKHLTAQLNNGNHRNHTAK